MDNSQVYSPRARPVMTESKGKVAIIGSGLIGSCWATLFVNAGYSVCLYDISAEQLDVALRTITRNLEKLENEGLSRRDETTEQVMKHITTTLRLEDALHGAIYAQESTSESVEFKRKIFSEMDKFASEEVILASSTSTIPASNFTEGLKHRTRCLVAHPVNPPLYLSLVEVVPAPWTTEAVVERTCEILKTIGQEPVRLNREVLGFAVNRLQYALLAEAWRLVADKVMSPEDVDKVTYFYEQHGKCRGRVARSAIPAGTVVDRSLSGTGWFFHRSLVMSSGLGPRYAFLGPLQTVHLNANGIRDYFARYGDGIRRVLADLGPTPTFTEPAVLDVMERSLNDNMPLERLASLKALREENLARLARLKKKLD
ncbi:hypothetical protein Q1695_010599 [Nippostrongylus brasiliensis]|nr:hypothetical protein Q1695_010599 [Nippostrongylus brasiliensis]